ncbi:hypothetical protein PDQ79_23635 [Bacillus cereus]|nr:hypothetical protein [Bacillus fungorum]MDA2637494.1 hypothetical protein [Bacillus cereus]
MNDENMNYNNYEPSNHLDFWIGCKNAIIIASHFWLLVLGGFLFFMK